MAKLRILSRANVLLRCIDSRFVSDSLLPGSACDQALNPITIDAYLCTGTGESYVLCLPDYDLVKHPVLLVDHVCCHIPMQSKGQILGAYLTWALYQYRCC